MYRIGIDLGGTNIAAGIVDEEGKLIYKDSIPTYKERESEAIVIDMAKLALKIIEDKNISIDEIISIGVGCPGTPDSKNGILVYNNNLNFNNVPIRGIIQRYIDKPVYISNDANCAALGEVVAGGAKGVANAIMITLGTGVGGGIVINHKIYDGFNNAGGELGHMVVVIDGEPCTCGRKGCLEAYASATALINQTIRAAKENPESVINTLVEGDYSKVNGKTAFDAMRAGDETGIKVVNQYIKYLAEGVLNFINIFQPEVLLVGGGICKEGDTLFNPIREMMEEHTYSKDKSKQTKIMRAVLGNDAGIIGAAMLDE